MLLRHGTKATWVKCERVIHSGIVNYDGCGGGIRDEEKLEAERRTLRKVGNGGYGDA